MLTFHQKPGEITSICDAEQLALLRTLDKVGKQEAKTLSFESTVGAMERALTILNENTNPVNFLKYVSPDEKVRAAANICETAVQKTYVDVFVREDLYRQVKSVKDSKAKLSSDDAFMLDEYLSNFERNGLGLTLDQRKVFIEKKKRLVMIEAEFSKNLVEWDDSLPITEAELDGLPENYKKGLKKNKEGKYLITLDYPHYYPFMENAKSSRARQLLEEKFWKRGGEKNKALLDEALSLRKEMAKMLGFPNHAAYILDKRMAKNTDQVFGFLVGLKKKLIPLGKSNLAELQKYKKADTGSSEPIQSFEWRYYDTALKKQKYDVDVEKIRPYFPVDVVVAGMFEIYQTLLSVKFEKVEKGMTWHPSVEFYRVMREGKVVAQFFMDLYPRDGKYGHAAAFTLISGYTKPDGSYQRPASAIVANFTPPGEGTPSLLEHSEVETLFHEFGHIMHQVLTDARYASYSGTSVKNDFVEAPSQMLENWVWNKNALSKMSSHYQTKKPLPEDLLSKLIAAKLVNSGIRYLRQLSYALIDMTYHTSEKVDATEVYMRLTQEIMMIGGPEGTYPQASYGHIMGGYDAGYYGYLWSKVYAQDMFTRFEREGVLNTKTGQEYLKWILQPGGLKDPFDLIKGFLGRPSNDKAFLKSIGL